MDDLGNQAIVLDKRQATFEIKERVGPGMARGWESKSVEQQQADMADSGKSPGPRLSSAQQKLNRQRDGLLLARKRLVDQLQSSTRPGHRQMLAGALAEIDKQLAHFEKLPGVEEQK